MRRRRHSALSGSPLLIGAVTTLIVIVAVYLAYNANHGLPFVPTYNINAMLPNGSNLLPGNEVRIGGRRVGVVASMTPVQNPRTGKVTALVKMHLEKNVEPLPANTTTVVQSISAIGLKYLQLNKGNSTTTLKVGATIPVAQSREPVELGELFDMFDKKTRIASQHNLNNFGDGLAGRGVGLNETLTNLRPLVTKLTPVMRNLASPQTGLHELFVALDRAASTAAPVAHQQASLYSDLDTFFTAFAGASSSLEKAIEGGPAALEQATHSLPFEASFVDKSTEFMHLLRPSAKELTVVARPLANAFSAGEVDLRQASALNTRLASALTTLKTFSQNPVVSLGLEDLAQTATLGEPVVAGIAPEQVTCNYVTLAFRNLASLLSESIGVGTVARVVPVLAPEGPNNEGYPSAVPANGPSTGVNVTTRQVVDNNHLHANPYPNVAGPGQPKECEAGNETYTIGRKVTGNLQTNVGTGHEQTTREAGLPGAPKAGSSKESSSGEESSSTKGKANKRSTKGEAKKKSTKGKANKKAGAKKSSVGGSR